MEKKANIIGITIFISIKVKLSVSDFSILDSKLKVKINSLTKDIFVGQLKSVLTCTVCDYKSVTFDPFWDLSLPIPTSSSVSSPFSSSFNKNLIFIYPSVFLSNFI